jgi:chromosome segregation ATPase
MKPTPEETAELARKIADAEQRLQWLEEEINEIGQPAAHELKRRLDAMKIEEAALKRNLAEALGMDDPGEKRMIRIETLLDYIRREEAAVEREAEFLHQSPPTSAEVAAQAGSKLLQLCLRAIHRVVGGHHPLGMSVFVNHSPQLLEERYGVGRPENPPVKVP